jgi:hypothetical protein
MAKSIKNGPNAHQKRAIGVLKKLRQVYLEHVLTSAGLLRRDIHQNKD